MFGSINEKIYLAEAGAKYTTYIPAAFPGPVVRRSVGTPFMGYRGCVYVIQEVVNALYETLFNFLPVDSAYAKQKNRNGAAIAAPSTQQAGNLPWQTEAKLMLDEALEAIPFVPRISASRELQMKVEAVAMEREMAEVSAELVQEILAAQSG